MKLLVRLLTALIVIALAVAALGYFMPERFALLAVAGVFLLFLSTVLLGALQLVQARQRKVG